MSSFSNLQNKCYSATPPIYTFLKYPWEIHPAKTKVVSSFLNLQNRCYSATPPIYTFLKYSWEIHLAKTKVVSSFLNLQKGDFERGQGKNIIQDNIVWTKSINLGRYVDSFELFYLFLSNKFEVFWSDILFNEQIRVWTKNYQQKVKNSTYWRRKTL